MLCSSCKVRYTPDPVFEQCPACGRKEFKMVYEALLTTEQVDRMIADMERFPFIQIKKRLR